VVNKQIGLNCDNVTFDTLEKLLLAIKIGKVDMNINPITVTTERMERMDFSQTYFISETDVAKKDDSNFIYILQNVVSWNFLKVHQSTH
jgi:ABC-type amino acid transport substrate-binding protein